MKLGKRQQAVMECMNRYRVWPSGFQYGNASETDAILRSLARLGLVEHLGDGGNGYGEYRLPESGQQS